MKNNICITILVLALICIMGFPVAQTAAQTQAPSPELVDLLTKGLKVTPEQATGGAGSLFQLAKTRLKPEEFSQVAAVVPGMNGFLKAVPKPSGASALGSLASSLPSSAASLTSVAGAFKSLGLSPDMVSKFVPVLTQFVQSKGGTKLASLLTGALK